MLGHIGGVVALSFLFVRRATWIVTVTVLYITLAVLVHFLPGGLV